VSNSQSSSSTPTASPIYAARGFAAGQLVKIRATTVNRTDCHISAADPFLWRFFMGFRRPKRQRAGREVAAVGSAVSEFQVGDCIFGINPWKFGAHAEYVCMPESAPLAHKPVTMTFEQAAAVCDGALTALLALRRINLHKGQRILIYGASGSTGTAAVQLSRHLGADVNAVCNTKTSSSCGLSGRTKSSTICRRTSPKTAKRTM
jgi:NADPH:quinone reductase-like Zn-dependent oxidoreductase